MPAYILADIDIKDPATYERYKEMAPASIAKYKGKYLVRGAMVTSLEGDWKPGRLVLLEFADADTARAWWNSPEYSAARKVRQSCAKTDMLLIEGPAFDPSK